MTVAAHSPAHAPRPVPDRTPVGIRRCLLAQDVPVFDAEFRAACTQVADEGVARIDAVQDVLRRWYTVARFSMDPDAELRRREEERRIAAGGYDGGCAVEDFAARHGIGFDAGTGE